jgi:hypothetical protein
LNPDSKYVNPTETGNPMLFSAEISLESTPSGKRNESEPNKSLLIKEILLNIDISKLLV